MKRNRGELARPYRGKRVVRAILGILVVATIGLVVLDWEIKASHRRALDAIVLPPQVVRVHEQETGCVICLSGSYLERRYQSSLSREETFQVFVAELRRLGYGCSGACAGVDSDGVSRLSSWTGSRAPLSLIVYGSNTGAPPAFSPVDPDGAFAIISTKHQST